jgi:hypothetical protein
MSKEDFLETLKPANILVVSSLTRSHAVPSSAFRCSGLDSERAQKSSACSQKSSACSTSLRLRQACVESPAKTSVALDGFSKDPTPR